MNRRGVTRLMAGLIPTLIASMLIAHVATAQGASGGSQLTTMQKRLLSGFASFALDRASLLSGRPDSLAEPSIALPLGQAMQALNGLDPADPANYNPGTRGCGFRTGSNVNPSRIVVAFGSYINPNSKESNGCTPAGFAASGNGAYTGVKTAGACNNDILVSVSTNTGVTFTGGTTDPRSLTSATPLPAQATSDQWFQWIAFTRTGRLAISYYDRQYGDDETTGFSDVSLSGSPDFTRFAVKRVTSSSMPPPTQFGGRLWGDHAGLTALDQAHPVWSDTRNPELLLCPGTGVPGVPPSVCLASASNAVVANDQDVYTQSLGVPAH